MLHVSLTITLALLYPLELFWAFRQHRLWRAGLILNVLLLFFLGYVHFYIVLACILLALLSLVNGQETCHPRLQSATRICVILLALLLGFHLLPGFERIVFFSSYTLSGYSNAFPVSYPVDKAIAVILLLGFGTVFSTRRPPALTSIFVTTLLVVLGVIAFAIPAGYLALDVKFKWPVLIWAYGNIFITVVAEEAFFRGIIQYHLYNGLRHKTRFAMFIALFLSSLAFALAHYTGGTTYIIIAFIAGLGYGAIYAKNTNLLDSILVHFLANLTHIILFTYPHLVNYQ